MTVGIYIRVSTQEQVQEGYSIAAQRERLTAYCNAQGWDDYKFYVDEGISAKNTNRPQLQLLLEHVKNGKISVILVYRLDRFTRSVSDLYELLDMLEKYNCAFKSATEIYDTSSAMGRMFIGLVALLAQWERENMSERIKMALEEKVSGGEHVGAVPFGFDLSENERLVKNEKAAVLLDIVQKVRSGMSLNQVTKYLNLTNSDKEVWHINSVYRLLRNPALYGATRWVDKVYENTHEGVITKKEFVTLQALLDDRMIHRIREVEGNYIFQGVLACPKCGKMLSVNRHFRVRKDGTKVQGSVYRCQHCYKAGEKLNAIGEKRFLQALKIYMAGLKFEYVEPIQAVDTERTLLEEQLAQVERQREKYQKAWSKDLMTDEEFSNLMQETRSTYEDLKTKLEQSVKPISLDPRHTEKIAKEFNAKFGVLTQSQKREFIARYIRKITFEVIPQPPKRTRHKFGKGLVVITDIKFY